MVNEKKWKIYDIIEKAVSKCLSAQTKFNFGKLTLKEAVQIKMKAKESAAIKIMLLERRK